MTPILFESTETAFTSQGLGRLSDAIDCFVTEQVNDEYELEMTYPIDGVHFDLIQEGRIILAKHSEKTDSQPFVIYKISKPMNGKVTVNAEHISYRLTKEVVKPCSGTTVVDALSNIKSNSIDCPFTFWTDKTTSANFSLDHPETIRKVLGGMVGSILDVYTGEYEWDKFTVKLWQNRGADNGVTIRYGKNLTDLMSEIDVSGIYTACTPYWKKEDYVKYLSPNPVVKSPYYDDFPYGLTVSLDCSQLLTSDNPEYEPSDSELENCALSYMERNATHIANQSIKVSFIPLTQTEEYKEVAPLERVSLCDWVTVIHEKLGVSVKMKVTETVYNVLLEKYDSMVLGNATRTLSKAVNNNISQSINQEMSVIASELDGMRSFFFGAHDSYRYLERDANGNVIATYYMDTDDVSTAMDIMRIDSRGIYFTNDGINGDFTSAWTIDGKFNANFIQTGAINANLITVGKIKASVLDITGTASFYADENTDAYGVVIMPDKGNIFDRELGYCRVDAGNTYFIGGAYTDILFGPNTSISSATSIKTQVELNDNTYTPTTVGYIFLTGWDGSSTVDVSQGDAIVGGWKPWNPTRQDYDEFRKLWRIKNGGEAYLKEIHLSTVAGESGFLELTDGDKSTLITPYTPICLEYGNIGLDSYAEYSNYRLWDNGRLEYMGLLGSTSMAKQSGTSGNLNIFEGTINLPTKNGTPIFKASTMGLVVNLTLTNSPSGARLGEVWVYDGNVIRVTIYAVSNLSSIVCNFMAHIEGPANPNAFPNYDF